MKCPLSNADGVERIHFKAHKSHLDVVIPVSDAKSVSIGGWIHGFRSSQHLRCALTFPGCCWRRFVRAESSTDPPWKTPHSSPALPRPGFDALLSAQSKAWTAASSHRVQIKCLSHFHRCALVVHPVFYKNYFSLINNFHFLIRIPLNDELFFWKVAGVGTVPLSTSRSYTCEFKTCLKENTLQEWGLCLHNNFQYLVTSTVLSFSEGILYLIYVKFHVHSECGILL